MSNTIPNGSQQILDDARRNPTTVDTTNKPAPSLPTAKDALLNNLSYISAIANLQRSKNVNTVVGASNQHAMTPSQAPTNTLEQMLVRSMDMIATQSAFFVPICQMALNVNLEIIKSHEEDREERRRIEEERRAERQRADEKHSEHMSQMLNQFGKLVDALQKNQMPSPGPTTVPNVNFKTPSPVDPVDASESYQIPVSSLSPKTPGDRSRMARRTGVPVPLEDGLKDLENPEKDEQPKSRRRSVLRTNVSIGSVLIGKGSGYNDTLKKFSSFKCRACPEAFHSERDLINHFDSFHEEELEGVRRKRCKKRK